MVRQKIKSFFKGFGYTILILFLVFMVFLGYGHINNRWYKLIYVRSDSMTPIFKAGDLILITRPPYNLNPGDIITFQIKGEIVTHRIQTIENDGNIITKGDANKVTDDWGEYQIKKVAGIYRFKIPYLGYPIAYASSWVKGEALPFVKNLFVGTNAFFTNQDKISANLTAETTTTEEMSLALNSIVDNQSLEGQENQNLKIDFMINNNDVSTDKKEVLLSIQIENSQNSGEIQMRFNNDNAVFADETTGWEAFSNSKNWILSEGEAEKTVFIQIKDSVSNIFSASDSIIFKTDPITESTETTLDTTSSTITESTEPIESTTTVDDSQLLENSGN
jgi:signal peptidase